MELLKTDVSKLAELARLKLTDAEVDRYQKNLGAILVHVDRLQIYMKGKDVVVDRRVVSDPAELRADEPKPADANRDEFLASARAVKDGRIEVPGVFKFKQTANGKQ